MDIKTWHKGIDISIENVIRLRDDGILLMNSGSYGHAYFSFYMAIEEMAVAYFILNRMFDPEPKELKEFLEHEKKGPLVIFKIFKSEIPGTDWRLSIKKKMIKATMENLEKTGSTAFGSKKHLESAQYIMGKEYSRIKKLWDMRNRGLYVSPNKDLTSWHSPKDFKKDDLTEILEKLNSAITRLKEVRDNLLESYSKYEEDKLKYGF